MQNYLKIVQRLSQHFDSLDFVQIPRAKNAEANFLARLASLDDYNATSATMSRGEGVAKHRR